jgi:hypothetical protein
LSYATLPIFKDELFNAAQPTLDKKSFGFHLGKSGSSRSHCLCEATRNLIDQLRPLVRFIEVKIPDATKWFTGNTDIDSAGCDEARLAIDLVYFFQAARSARHPVRETIQATAQIVERLIAFVRPFNRDLLITLKDRHHQKVTPIEITNGMREKQLVIDHLFTPRLQEFMNADGGLSPCFRDLAPEKNGGDACRTDAQHACQQRLIPVEPVIDVGKHRCRGVVKHGSQEHDRHDDPEKNGRSGLSFHPAKLPLKFSKGKLAVACSADPRWLI